MSELVTDEMVEAVAKRLDPDAWEMTAGVYQESHGRHYGNAESFIQSARQTARGEARAILRLVAPLIATKALQATPNPIQLTITDPREERFVPVALPCRRCGHRN